MIKIDIKNLRVWTASIGSIYFLELFTPISFIIFTMAQSAGGRPLEFTGTVVAAVIMRMFVYAIPLALTAYFSSAPGRGSIIKSVMLAVALPSLPILGVYFSQLFEANWLYWALAVCGSLAAMFLLSMLKADRNTLIAVFLLAPLPSIFRVPELLRADISAGVWPYMFSAISASVLFIMPAIAAYFVCNYRDKWKNIAYVR